MKELNGLQALLCQVEEHIPLQTSSVKSLVA